MRIIGYCHILLQNHWYSVVIEQVRILLTSGLYDVCETINVGCVGSRAEREIFKKLILNLYPKFKLRYFSQNVREYEFPTLALIEKEKGDYAGFYFHTKGITRPFETYINHWREWCNESILNRWQEHYKRILQGYEVSSVNEMKSPDHFSGNFWWFNRKYINKLPPVRSLNHNNRFTAEQWICMCKNRKTYAKEFIEPGRDVFKIKYKTS